MQSSTSYTSTTATTGTDLGNGPARVSATVARLVSLPRPEEAYTVTAGSDAGTVSYAAGSDAGLRLLWGTATLRDADGSETTLAIDAAFPPAPPAPPAPTPPPTPTPEPADTTTTVADTTTDTGTTTTGSSAGSYTADAAPPQGYRPHRLKRGRVGIEHVAVAVDDDGVGRAFEKRTITFLALA